MSVSELLCFAHLASQISNTRPLFSVMLLSFIHIQCHHSHTTGNMMLFDKDGLIRHYSTPEEVVAEFYELRLHYYELRRQALLRVGAASLCILLLCL